MAGLIPQHFIDDVLDRADIVEVVGSRVALRKAGKNYSACCPFHEEKTPSFTVSPDKQFYYCFGCGAGGNSIGFMMEHDHIGFVDAVEDLARKLGLQVPREQSSSGYSNRNKPLYALLEKADKYYRSQLRQHPKAGQAVDYLKNRGLSGQIAAEFGIGYAPPGWDNVLVALGEPDDPNLPLIEAGLVVNNEEKNSQYDRFRNRIMFPIRDLRGRVIAFGGRVLGDDKPKYLNSPETPVFHKGRELYGLYEANKALRDISCLLVVEGYMDVVALAQFGIRNAVATLGTAATEQHLEKIFRYTGDVVFCFDGDEAGRKAARRALENALPVMEDGRAAKFLFLDEGEDPDSLVRKIGSDAFQQQVSEAMPLSEFVFLAVSDGVDSNSQEGKARLKVQAAPLINKLPEGVFKELMLKQLADLTEMDQEALREMIAPPVSEQPSPLDAETALGGYSTGGASAGGYPADGYSDGDYPGYAEFDDRDSYSDVTRAAHQRPQKTLRLPPEKMLISLLLNHPEFAVDVSQAESLAALENDALNIFVSLVELLKDNPEYTFNHILGYWRGVYDQQQAELLAGLAATDMMQAIGDATRDDRAEFFDILTVFLKRAIGYLPPEQLLRILADGEVVSDMEIKHAYSAWNGLDDEERKAFGSGLLQAILGKPRS